MLRRPHVDLPHIAVCDSDDPDHAVRGIDCSGAEEGVVESVENLFGRVDPSDRSMRGQRSSPAW